MTGYFRFPTIHEDRIVFVSEDDLWAVPRTGGVARRLTSGLGETSRPFFSPDGSLIAFTGTEDGTTEIYVMPSHGGPSTQVTFLGAISATTGWTPDGMVVFRTHHRQGMASRLMELYSVSPDGGEPSSMKLGPGHGCDFEPFGPGIIVSRNADDLARWKRYKGGTAGVLWLSRDGEKWQRLFADEPAGHCRPMWLNERIYFVSDRDGHGNLWSCDVEGNDLQKHSNHDDFYVRFASTDGRRITYTAGGAIYVYDPVDNTCQRVEVDYASPQTQLNRKFVEGDAYLEDIALHPAGHSLAIVTRGKLFNFAHWEGGVRQNGVEQGVRYRLPVWLDDTNILVVSDESGEERFEIHVADGSAEPKILTEDPLIGRPLDIALSPDRKLIAFHNQRQEIGVIEVETGAIRILDRSEYDRMMGFDWSGDSRFLAYSSPNSFHTTQIKIADLVDGSIQDATSGEFKDVEPVFDPGGRYLYFLSYRFFEPVYDQLFFEISFPASMKPCLITLRPDIGSPFVEKPRALDGEDDDEKDDKDKDDDSEDSESKDDEKSDKEKRDDEKDAPPKPVEIDFMGIFNRVEAFPVAVGEYSQLAATAERVFWTSFPLGAPEVDEDHPAPSFDGRVSYFSLKDYETKLFAPEVAGFVLGPDRKTMGFYGESLRLVSASGPGLSLEEDEDDRPSRKSGIVDFSRVSVAVDTRDEWRQMLREAWRLMRDHFWSAELGGLDWDAVWLRYAPLVDHTASRSEFSDLVWEMQGELGTSHAYEFGGDYRRPPAYRPGFLGADIDWNEDAQAYQITHIVQGDTWNAAESSAFARPGIDAENGDRILAINGQRLGKTSSVQQRLVNLIGQEVEIVLQRGDADPHRVTVRTLLTEFPARYREWVNTCRQRVHEATDGKVGYIHIPDMSVNGFAEFHRGFVSEFRKNGLIVDVRANGGGHVSQLLLEKLARRTIGYDVSRYGVPRTYPDEAVNGPLVAITDEHAGSDGDIFSHCFKLMKLGPLIGKRTWGGVVGIWPRHALVDGSITTQPEFSFWFKDVGYAVENFGTVPDIEVEISPAQAAAGHDPQLEKAIEVAISKLSEAAPAPVFGPPPRLTP